MLLLWQCPVCHAWTHTAQVDSARERMIKTILPLFSLHLHADVKGPAITIKASWSQAFSLGDA